MKTEYWLIRHARSLGHGVAGWTDADCDLSDKKRLDSLRAELPGTAQVITSDLKRTIKTARAVQRADWTWRDPDPDLREQNFGDWEGLSHHDVAEQDNANQRRFWTNPAYERPPNGECFADVAERCVPPLLDLSGEAGPLICVLHAGVIRAFLGEALDLPHSVALRFAIENLSLTRIERFEMDHETHWRVVCVNA